MENDVGRAAATISINGPKFWAVTAVISGLCTLSSVLTFFEGCWTDGRTFQQISGLAPMAALGSGFLGLISMILGGCRNVGRIEVRGRLLPAWGMPFFVGVACGAPWASFAWIVWNFPCC